MLFHEYAERNSESTFFFTDGSCYENKVGSAAVGHNWRFNIRLPDYTTVFSAEVYAIRKVLEYIKDKNIKQATICSDSKSALQALEKIDSISHNGIGHILKLNLELEKDQHVTFLWIPGHFGIEGNDQADMLAKEAAMQEHPSEVPLSQGDMFHLINVKFSEYLQHKWNQNHSNHFYAIKPNLKPWVTCSQPDRVREVTLARLRYGHTRLTHRHLLDRTEPPMCPSCNVRITVAHILINCAAVQNKRQQIRNHLMTHRLPNNLSTLLGDDSSITDLVLDFILGTLHPGEL